ncbi:MAG: hypothetical protein KBI47_08800 [Armatimonadetes bacterium]|nr:hypothetical protein [Armatimonadota bacterium]MDI9587228.1 hypothetical protein [Acidobacteriota bacterium]
MSVKANLRVPAARCFANIPLFEPQAGTTVREPLGAGPGWWAGAPCCVFDPADERFYLYYRMRKPRELGRGVDCRIAASTDGLQFEDIWSATKEQINTQSMEKASLIRGSGGDWMLYLSFVDTDGRWCIELCSAPSIPELDPTQRVRILGADDIAAEGVKDPCVYNICGLYHMIVSYAPTPAVPDPGMHATGDIYNTGVTKSHTGLATSEDGIHWDWVGDILSPPDQGWDKYCTRIGSIASAPPFFLGFYDGSASVEDNYEERAGMCISTDLRSWERITKAGPFILSPHAQRTIRYIEVVQCDDALFYYYEYCRPDGSHELRANKVQLG